MIEYAGQLIRVIDGSTLEAAVEIGGGQTDNKIIRLSGVQTDWIKHNYEASIKGAGGSVAALKVKMWFYDKADDIDIDFYMVDICGRWLCDIYLTDGVDSLNDYMISQGYRSDDWLPAAQQAVINTWFSGGSAVIPGGAKLPTWHNWGAGVFNQFNQRVIGL